MKQLIIALFLVLAIGFTNGNHISSDDFAVDGTSFVKSDNGPNDGNDKPLADSDRDNEIYFDDISDGSNHNLDLAKYLLKSVLQQIPNYLHGKIRYQDNRFWNLTFLNTNAKDAYLHLSVMVNLEALDQPKSTDYSPLPGQFYIEARLSLESTSNQAENTAKLLKVAAILEYEEKHPDGVQMNILKQVLPQIQERLHVTQYPLRYGQFMIAKSYPTETGQQIQVAVVLETKSNFCRELYPKPCPFVPIYAKSVESSYFIQVKQEGESVELSLLKPFFSESFNSRFKLY